MTKQELQEIREDQWATDREIKLLDEVERLGNIIDKLTFALSDKGKEKENR